MGLFGFFSSPEDKRKEEVRSGAVAPDRTERKRCWEARDSFYACLDRNNTIDALSPNGKKVADGVCSSQHSAFKQDCAAAWVDYFKKSRVAEYKKKQTFERLEREGARQVEMDSTPTSSK